MIANVKNKLIAVIFSALPAVILLLIFIKKGNNIEWCSFFLVVQVIGSLASKKYFYVVGVEYFIFGLIAFVWIAFSGYEGGRVLFFDNDYLRFLLASVVFLMFCWVASFLLKTGD